MNIKLIGYAILLVVSGSFTTLMTKWLVTSEACGAYDCKTKKRTFIHPYVLSLMKFIGEMSCLFIYVIWRAIKRRRSGNQQMEPFLPCCRWFVFLPPAMCSLVAIITVHIGLNLTYNATSQMLRGTSVFFNGLLSVAFLAQTVLLHQWVGMIFTALGLVAIGSADIIFNEKHDISQPSLNAIIAGGLLILLAEIIAATQSVLEQRFIRKYNVSPLLAVGLEGLFGTIFVGSLIAPMYYIHANLPLTKDPDGRLENIWDAFLMMKQNWHILVGAIGSIAGGAVFNYAGLVIIKEHSAVTKSVLDSCQTVPTWIVFIIAKFLKFSAGSITMQICGSVLVLFVGPTVYFDKLFAPWLRKRGLLKERSPWDYSGDDFNRRPSHPEHLQDWSHHEEREPREFSANDDDDGDDAPLIHHRY